MKIKITQCPYIYNGVFHPGEFVALAIFSNKTSSNKFSDIKILLTNNPIEVSSEKTSNLQEKT
jgi:hypothetical protein